MPSFLSSSRTRLTATAAVLVIGITACTPAEQGGAASSPATLPPFTTTGPTTSTSPTAGAADEADQSVDYGRLLLTGADLSDAEDTFVERSKDVPPNGVAGSTAFFVNETDTRAITDTVLVYPDAATASAAYKQASDKLPTLVTGGAPAPGGVGEESVVISGSSPEENKAVTVLLFTEGRSLVRLRFESAEGDATTDRFVTSIGKMQQIALRTGLDDSR